ncbi:MAG: hypothetical protein ACO2O2_17125, partial [Acidilobaceae archaeon]
MSSLAPLLITLLLAAQILTPALYNENHYSVQQAGLDSTLPYSTSTLDPRPGLSVAGFWSWQDY